jgi:hypothetical protein
MVSMSDELEEGNILKLILIVRFGCVTLDVGHPIFVHFLLSLAGNIITISHQIARLKSQYRLRFCSANPIRLNIVNLL